MNPPGISTPLPKPDLVITMGTLGETREKISAPPSGAGVGVAVGSAVGVGAGVSVGAAVGDVVGDEVGDEVGAEAIGVGVSAVDSSPLRSHIAPRIADSASMAATAMMSFANP